MKTPIADTLKKWQIAKKPNGQQIRRWVNCLAFDLTIQEPEQPSLNRWHYADGQSGRLS
jgi:hypothetical protein